MTSPSAQTIRQDILSRGITTGFGLGSVAAAVAMGWYTWRTHPMLQHDLRDTPLGEVPDDRL